MVRFSTEKTNSPTSRDIDNVFRWRSYMYTLDFLKKMHDYKKRFEDLLARGNNVTVRVSNNYHWADTEEYRAWLSSAINLIEMTFGKGSTFTKKLNAEAERGVNRKSSLEVSRGLFRAAKEEFELGLIENIRKEISDEFVVDLCLRAEEVLREGHLEPAAVLVAAALEDCFRRKAETHDIDTENKTLSDYINALKARGAISGATSKIVAGYPKFRNAALHADWNKINEADVMSISAFLKVYAIQS